MDAWCRCWHWLLDPEGNLASEWRHYECNFYFCFNGNESQLWEKLEGHYNRITTTISAIPVVIVPILLGTALFR